MVATIIIIIMCTLNVTFLMSNTASLLFPAKMNWRLDRSLARTKQPDYYDNNADTVIPLSAGAALKIANDEYEYGMPRPPNVNRDGNERYGRGVTDELLEGDQRRITMQVVGLSRLKYSIVVANDEEDMEDMGVNPSREDAPISYADDSKYWGDCTPYRLLLSDGAQIVAGKFHCEYRGSVCWEAIHGHIHRLVSGGRLKEGSIVSFVPNSHPLSGRGMVSIFHMKIEGWRPIEGEPTPCHSGVVAYSPVNVHQCTVPHLETIRPTVKPINSAVILLARTIQDICGHCVISGSAVLAEHLHSLPGCNHCYDEQYGPFVRSLRQGGGNFFNNDVDIFVPEYRKRLTHYYETGEKRTFDEPRGSFGITIPEKEFTEDTLQDIIFPALFKRHGIRHSSIFRTNVQILNDDSVEGISVENGDRSINPYHGLGYDNRGNTKTAMDYGWLRLFVGLQRKLEFNLWSTSGE